MADATRWGIAGAGAISGDFVNAIKLLPSSDHKVCSVASRDLSRAEDFAKEHSIPQAYGSYEELAQDNNIDVIYVGVIHTHHFTLCKLMLGKGKNVLCEKPLTMNARLARELVSIARENKVFFMEAVWSRCFPAYKQLRTELANKTVGDIKLVQVDFGQAISHIARIHELELGGGALLDLGMYAVQFATMVFDEMPQKIVSTGVLNETGADEGECVTLLYSGGRMAQLNIHSASWLRNTAVVYGTKGNIQLPNFWCPEKLITPDKTYDFPLPKSSFTNTYFVSEGLMYEAQTTRMCLLEGQKECELMPLKHTIMDMEILDEARKQLGVKYKEDQE